MQAWQGPRMLSSIFAAIVDEKPAEIFSRTQARDEQATETFGPAAQTTMSSLLLTVAARSSQVFLRSRVFSHTSGRP